MRGVEILCGLKQSLPNSPLNTRTFDYVVVGAGSAGCVLASRLSEDPDVSVLLLEAGPPDRNPLIRMPTGEVFLIGRSLDWRFRSDPEPGLASRQTVVPRGRVIGGSSSINGQLYVRGHPRDYDEWRQLGCTGWSYADVLPYYKKSESWQPGESDTRGGEGPLKTAFGRYDNPLFDAFVDAGEQTGYRKIRDFNGAEQEGFGWSQYTHTHHRPERCSASRAYLKPARHRPNLVVWTRARCTRVTIDAGRATGVELIVNGSARRVAAQREVLLSAGAYQSPQLLMLSGIGEPEALRSHGIDVVYPSPGVGANLQDHVGALVQHRCLKPVTYAALRNPLRALSAGLRYVFFKDGPLAVFPMNVQGYVRSDPALERPDLQFFLMPSAVVGEKIGYLPKYHAYAIHWALLRPTSRGRVDLSSADPLAAPRILHNYLTTPEDCNLNREGFRIARTLHSQRAFDGLRGEEETPGVHCTTDAEIDAFNASASISHYHPVGTCRMGIDDEAVLDPELRVRGIDALRVVDASIMPRLVGGNTNAPTIMIGEKAADMIRRGQ
jgi:choline dehydrogenase